MLYVITELDQAIMARAGLLQALVCARGVCLASGRPCSSFTPSARTEIIKSAGKKSKWLDGRTEPDRN